MYYLHKKGGIVEYSKSETFHGKTEYRAKSRFLDELPVFFFDWEFEVLSKEQALQAAMDYHETEGCKLYLELYPAPEKEMWNFIAQDMPGDWYGYEFEPKLIQDDGTAMWTKGFVPSKSSFICKSPPNPFWRKTLR